MELNSRTLERVFTYLAEMSGGAWTHPSNRDGMPVAMPHQIAYHLGMAEAYRILATQETPLPAMKEIREAADAVDHGLDWYRRGLSDAKRAINGREEA